MNARPFALTLFACLAAQAWGQDKPLSTAHDGAWRATIVCEDFRSEKGALAKGYTVTVPLIIAGGKIEGVRDRVGAASGELQYVGEVREGGELVIRAIGATGKPDYTPNRVAPGTSFGYTLKGQLGTSTGSAERVELRPCKASFARTS
jgi:hypothetical protein